MTRGSRERRSEKGILGRVGVREDGALFENSDDYPFRQRGCARRQRGWRNNAGVAVSRGALQRHDGQVSPGPVEGHFHFHARARVSADERPRPRTRRGPRPARPRLESWLAIGRKATVIDLVGRLAAEPGVRTVAVVPFHGRVKRVLPASVRESF